MQCNPSRWLWGLIPIVMLTWGTFHREQPNIEVDLAGRAKSALEAGGQGWARVRMTGRDAVITGRSHKDGDAKVALDIVRGVWGVRTVELRTDLAEAEPPSYGVGPKPLEPGKVARAEKEREKEAADAARIRREAETAAAVKAKEAADAADALRAKQEAEAAAALKAREEAEAAEALKAKEAAQAAAVEKARRDAEAIATAEAKRDDSEAAEAEKARKDTEAAAAAEASRLAAEKAEASRRAYQAEMAAHAKAREAAETADAANAEKAREDAEAAALKAKTQADAAAVLKAKQDREATAAQKAKQEADQAAEAKADAEAKAGAEAEAEAKAAEAARAQRKTNEHTEKCQKRLADAAGRGVILFSRASADIDPKSAVTIGKLSEIAKSCPGTRIEVEGYTDSEGTDERNQKLSERRAKAVLRSLVHAGVGEDRLSSVGFGATHPAASNDTAAGKAQNRRIEFKVFSE